MIELTHAGNRILITTVICCSVSIILILVRFWCKYHLKSEFRLDDWAILTSVCTYLASAGVVAWGIFDGSHGEEVDELVYELTTQPSVELQTRITIYLKALDIAIILFFFTTYMMKMSLCFFYRRIFRTKQYQYASTALMVAASVWIFTFELTFIFFCKPMNHFWHLEEQGHCGNLSAFYLASGILDTVLDVATLLLPVKGVCGVQIPKRTKIILCCVFMLGGFYIITDILRLYYTYQPHSEIISFDQALFWANVHNATATFCTCVPVFQPVLAKTVNFAFIVTDHVQKVSRRVNQVLTGRPALDLPAGIIEQARTDPDQFGLEKLKSQTMKGPRHHQDSIDSSGTEAVIELVPGQPEPGSYTSVSRGEYHSDPLPGAGITVTTEYEVV